LFPKDVDYAEYFGTAGNLIFFGWIDEINQETNQMYLNLIGGDIPDNVEGERCYLVADVDPNMGYMPTGEFSVIPDPNGLDYCKHMGSSFKYSNPYMEETGYLEIDGVNYFMFPWDQAQPIIGYGDEYYGEEYYGEEYYGEEDQWEDEKWEDDKWEEDEWNEVPESYELYLTEEGSDLS